MEQTVSLQILTRSTWMAALGNAMMSVNAAASRDAPPSACQVARTLYTTAGLFSFCSF
jgi:hypothetical protein